MVFSWEWERWIFILKSYCSHFSSSSRFFVIFKQSVKRQWLEQQCVNRTFAYRKLPYYNVHFHKLSVWGSQNMVTSLQEEETDKYPLLTRRLLAWAFLQGSSSWVYNRRVSNNAHVKQEIAQCLRLNFVTTAIIIHYNRKSLQILVWIGVYYWCSCMLTSSATISWFMIASSQTDKGLLCSTGSSSTSYI